MKKEQFDITGMTCSACSSRVEGCVVKLPGVKDVSVNLLKNSMVVSYDEGEMNTAGIVEAVASTGYGAIPKSDPRHKTEAKHENSTAQAEYKAMKNRLILSALFTLPLFYISMGHMMNWPLPSFLLGMENALVFAFTQFLLLLPVLAINSKYFKVGFRSLFKGAPNMDSLIAIGSGAAETVSAQTETEGEIPMEKLLKIEGMMCNHCVMHVQKALAAVPGVAEVVVSLEEKTAKVKLNQNVTDEVFKTIIEDAGYQLAEIA